MEMVLTLLFVVFLIGLLLILIDFIAPIFKELITSLLFIGFIAWLIA